MKQLTDEQYRDIGAEIGSKVKIFSMNVDLWKVLGRAAYMAAFPLAVEEALAEPDLTEITRAFSFVDATGAIHGHVAVKRAFANRLSHLTAKPDPAVEAVKVLLKGRAAVNCVSLEAIVAAVRAADKEAGRA